MLKRDGAVAGRVLLVNDDAVLREVIADTLVLEGYLVQSAEHGAAALEILIDFAPDVILLDYRMPVMDGAQFLTIYRQGSGPWAPIIGMSVGAIEMDVDAALSQPFDLMELLSIVARYVGTGY